MNENGNTNFTYKYTNLVKYIKYFCESMNKLYSKQAVGNNKIFAILLAVVIVVVELYKI